MPRFETFLSNLPSYPHHEQVPGSIYSKIYLFILFFVYT